MSGTPAPLGTDDEHLRGASIEQAVARVLPHVSWRPGGATHGWLVDLRISLTIIRSDGSKEHWDDEPRCEITVARGRLEEQLAFLVNSALTDLVAEMGEMGFERGFDVSRITVRWEVDPRLWQ